MKRQLRAILFAIGGAVLGVLVLRLVLRQEGNTVLAAVAGAVLGALASLGAGSDETKEAAEAARRGEAGRPGDAPHDIGGTEDEIEDAAMRAAAEDSEDAGGD